MTPTETSPRSSRPSQPIESRETRAVRRILVCIDHSRLSEACLAHAVAIAKSLGGAITLLHVMQPAQPRSGTQTTDLVDWEISRQQESAYLEGLEQRATLALGRPVETRLEQGQPAERIAAVARDLDADLTILGSQGERGLAGANLGSTAQRVLSAATGAVLVTPAHSSATSPVSAKRLLVALDGSLRAESVLPTAVRIASTHGAELLLVYVVREPASTAVLRAPEDLEVARDLATRLVAGGKRYLEDLRGQLVREGVSARTLVLRTPDEKQALLELSRSEECDLVVVSAHGETCNPALTCGSVTAHFLARSEVPLLVLQDLRDAEVRGPDRDRPAPALRARYAEGS